MTEDIEDTKVCPYCAETIKAAAIVCKHCGNNLDESAAPVETSQAVTEEPKKKQPVIGLIGMLMLVAGFCSIFVAGDSYSISIFLFIGGGGVLAYALVTGNLGLFKSN